MNSQPRPDRPAGGAAPVPGQTPTSAGARTPPKPVPGPPPPSPPPPDDPPEPPARHGGPLPRWLALVFLAVCVGLIPQIISLSSTLSEVQLANHWRTAWVGLDIAEAVVFLLTAWFLFRRSPLVSITASIAFAMLWLDAWFDVMTSVSADDIAVARSLAVFAELPLGVFCLFVALRPLGVLHRRRARTSARARRPRLTERRRGRG